MAGILLGFFVNLVVVRTAGRAGRLAAESSGRQVMVEARLELRGLEIHLQPRRREAKGLWRCWVAVRACASREMFGERLGPSRFNFAPIQRHGREPSRSH